MRPRPRAPSSGASCCGTRPCCSAPATTADGARARAGTPQHPVREVRRAQVPRGGPREGPVAAASHARQPRRTSWPGTACSACSRASARRPRGVASERCATRPGPATPVARLARSGGRAAPRGIGRRRRRPAPRRSADCRARPRRPLRRRCSSSGSPRSSARSSTAATTTPTAATGRPGPADGTGRRRPRPRAGFLAELTLDPPPPPSDLAGPPHLDDDWLILSTIHSAKGGEWKVVHLIHAADGNIPSDMATGEPEGLEEERRLLYVAMTPRPDALYVTYPLRYYHRRARPRRCSHLRAGQPVPHVGPGRLRSHGPGPRRGSGAAVSNGPACAGRPGRSLPGRSSQPLNDP